MATIPAHLYIKWVKRSLNLQLGTNLKPTAIADDDYKTFVYLFKSYQPGLKSDSLVDRATNDALVRGNTINVEYSQWVRKSLADLIGAPASLSGSLDSKDARQSIKKFQSSRKPKKLTDDGWVGVYTEMAIVRAGAKRPPGSGVVPVKPTPPPPSKPKIKTEEVLKVILERMSAVESDETIKCVMRKMLFMKRGPYFLPSSGAAKLRDGSAHDYDIYDQLVNLRKLMKTRIIRWQRAGTLTPKKFREKIKDEISDTISAIRVLKNADGHHIHIRDARKAIHRWSKRSDEIYGCKDIQTVVNEMMDVCGPRYSGNIDRPF